MGRVRRRPTPAGQVTSISMHLSRRCTQVMSYVFIVGKCRDVIVSVASALRKVVVMSAYRATKLSFLRVSVWNVVIEMYSACLVSSRSME